MKIIKIHNKDIYDDTKLDEKYYIVSNILKITKTVRPGKTEYTVYVIDPTKTQYRDSFEITEHEYKRVIILLGGYEATTPDEIEEYRKQFIIGVHDGPENK